MEAIIGLAIITITAVIYVKQKRKERLVRVKNNAQDKIALSTMAELAEKEKDQAETDSLDTSSQ